ncbi:hypothetical protein BD626DRAFT_410002 [Schizophyllum amplum]|uniref:Uncharacterized protein n=1 Tax=Schizophyllum amplum TaxID=97359 RepID=A0A550C1R5_9AGAR|nr:hypothetical protein BD626DRAFT_410002 [Auriculariopsis ampla]
MQHPLPPNVHRDSFLNLSGDEASPVRVNEHGVLASVSELPGETTPAAEGGPPSSSLGDRLGLDLGSKHESLRGAWDTLRGKRKRPRDPARPSTSDGLLSRAPVFSSPLSAGAPRLRTSSVSRRDLAASEGSPVSRPDASPVSRRGGPSPFSPPVRRGSIKIGGLPRRTNIEDITLVPGDGSEVGSSSLESHGVAGAHSMEDIQELPRAPGWHRPGKSADDLGERDGHGELPGRTIPSIWANADASGHRSPPVSPSRFGKLKGFTKRYSMSLTSFSQQSNISKKFLPKS